MDTVFHTPAVYNAAEIKDIKSKMLNWANRFSIFCFLDNHNYQIQPHTEECLLAAGVRRSVKSSAGDALDKLQNFIDEKPAWLFGHLGYELKNENFNTACADAIGFPDLFFFEPEIIIRLNAGKMMIQAEMPDAIFETICKMQNEEVRENNTVEIKNRLSRNEYCEIIARLKQHIQRGDCYEINYCHELYAEKVTINPLGAYKKLSGISPNPFSGLYKLEHRWLLCASPERFLKKQGSRILSQPIKGTAKRNLQEKLADELQKKELFASTKDRSENVMVVDLVRNDLAKLCSEGSVQVDELYGIYSFPQVHQMISTVSGELKKNISFAEIIRATFPMGSMTGAPKKRVMELIGQYEKTKRGIFSGAVGYMSPSGDFDFNVVIRSILYNAETHFLSFPVGSGITFYSDPEKEWEECEMKAEAMRSVLQ